MQTWHEEWAHAVYRVLKPGAHLVAFGGTRTYHRLACALEDAGFEIRDSLMWIYGSGFPKSLNLDGDWQGWGTALKPAHEPIVLARKPLAGTVAANVAEHGCGALNIAGCRVGGQRLQYPAWEHEHNLCNSCVADAASGAKQKTRATKESTAERSVAQTTRDEENADRSGTNKAGTGCSNGPSMEERADDRSGDTVLSIATSGSDPEGQSPPGSSFTTRTATGLTIASVTCVSCGAEITRDTTSGANGRWPPNLLLTHAVDCGDECAGGCPVREMDRQSGECPGMGKTRVLRRGATTGRGLGYQSSSPQNAEDEGYGDSGGASRFFPRFRYEAKAASRERNAGLDLFPVRAVETRSPRAAGTSGNAVAAPGQNFHPTVKPVALMRWLCRLVTPPGGLILDPFLGSGTTMIAALREGFRCVGIEREAEYVSIARRRVEEDMPLFNRAGLIPEETPR